MSQYVIVRDDEYLQHWGIKGQKWGVRRYENEDGTLTEAGKKRYSVNSGGNKKFEKKYNKEAKKLEKLGKYADLDEQNANVKKYGKIANIATGIGTAGVGVAVGGARVVAPRIFDKLIRERYGKEQEAYNFYDKSYANDLKEIRNMESNPEAHEWLDIPDDAYGGKTKRQYLIDYTKEQHRSAYNKEMDTIKKDYSDKVQNVRTTRDIVRTASLATAAVAFGVAGYSKIQQSLAKKRVTQLGHAKAVMSYKAQVNKMMNTFGGTKYSDFLKAEVNAYQELHPNSQMSSKEIEKMFTYDSRLS